METPAKIRKIESPGCTNKDTSTKYANLHCSQSCMRLYLRGEDTDVHFVFQTSGEERKIPAHRFILGIGSQVFHTMFYGTLQEAGDIRIVDATFEAFKMFLQFFYLDSVAISMEYVDEMMYLAKKYDVTECFNVCETLLKEKLPIENVCYVIQLALTYDRGGFVESLKQKISEQPTTVFESNSFTNCSWGILKLILEIENLDCEEKAVFDACMVWSEKACKKNDMDPTQMKNRREQLGDCFRLIQFALMQPQHILECISEYKDFFDRDELIEFIALLASDRYLKLQTSNRKRASQNVHQFDVDKILLFRRIYPNADDYYFVMETEVTPFQIDKNLLLGCISTETICPLARCSPMTLSGVMKIVDCTSEQEERILLEQPVDFLTGNKQTPQKSITLVQPIVVESTKLYEIRFEFDSGWSVRTFHCKKLLTTQIRSFGNCRLIFGKDNTPGNGIVSELFFNSIA